MNLRGGSVDGLVGFDAQYPGGFGQFQQGRGRAFDGDGADKAQLPANAEAKRFGLGPVGGVEAVAAHDSRHNAPWLAAQAGFEAGGELAGCHGWRRQG